MPKIIRRGGGGGLIGQAGNTTLKVNQVAHGFGVQDAIYYDDTTSAWQKAQANAITTLGIGVVSKVSDVDNFEVITDGEIEGLSGLTDGKWYYVSDATAGLLTLTESSIYSNPLLVATSANTGIVMSLRAQDLGGSTARATRSDYDSANLQYLYTGTADTGSAESAAVWRISRYSFIDGIITYADSNQNYDNVWDNRESLTYS